MISKLFLKNKIIDYIKLMRMKHYIKNFLIFLPIIFSLNFYEIEKDIKVLIGFIIFSLLSSIVYIINDIQDIDNDRKHPEKSKRPIASGRVTKRESYILIAVLIIVIITINILFKMNYDSIVILLIYLVLNILYSKKLKKIQLLDVLILVTYFLLRVIYGASLINVKVSHWLYLTIISFSFYLSLGKRRNELMQLKGETREVLKYYTKDFLDKNMYMFLTLTNVFYSLWCVDVQNIEKFGTSYFILTVPLVIIICMKYSLNIENNSSGDPVEVLLSDKILIMLVIFYFIIMLGLIVI